ncbi:alpha/beta hydrolase family protein [Stieleria sp. TO1_6]|uniref:alpha/beta hydrolase family protein n=1 Tax=Stieleria tagensis TaxID=2956795 RepID=UPI00209AB321|nr:alpha/beta hydrolase family protein [Stieleria tagensis]MCO8122755.1 alpha/beta hydrolase family protein [Stieleria tagensis]
MLSRISAWVFTLALVAIGVTDAAAQPAAPAATAPAAQPAVTEKLKTLNDHFPFVVPETVAQWDSRRDALKRRVLVATGLWPMPQKTTLQPVLHGKLQRDGFTVEKVYFESLPGHFVSGMLFRPADDNPLGLVDGKRPGVLTPHGHGGRTMRLSDSALAEQLESGGEVFERSGRYPKLARCAHLARMGCVTFIFDMLGYADSQQISYTVAHRHADARPEESDRENPCFYSIDADLNLQSIMGLQTWNAIRALDFLAELDDVDADRLAVTGGSGGGTQTILLDAIDPRIKVSFPNGMVSTAMQGGCYCENCNYLRIDTGNVELAALYAPRPQGMTAAKDWTRDMLTDGYPELKRLYTMLGKPQNVMCGDVLQFPHNYNYVTRAMMYPWMAKHLGLPSDTPLTEADFKPFTEQDMQVWDDQHPAPSETGVEHERDVIAWWKAENDRALDKLVPSDSDGPGDAADKLKQYRQVVGGAWSVFFDRQLPAKSDLEITKLGSSSDPAAGEVYLVRHPQWNTQVKVNVQRPADVASKQTIVYAGAQDASANNDPSNASATVIMPQLLAVLDSNSGRPQQQLIDDKRTYSGFTFTYNRPLVSKWCEQLLCTLAAFAPEGQQPVVLHAAGDGAAASAVAAAVIAGDQVDDLVVQTDGKRLRDVQRYSDASFLPGASKYFDLPGLMALRAPHAITVVGETEASLDMVRRLYSAAGASEQLQLQSR